MVCVPIKTSPPFQKSSAVIVSEIDNVKKVALITTATIEHDLKSGCFFRTCSVATSLVTSLEFDSHLFFYAVLLPANYETVPWSLIPTPKAALPQAVLQENTETFRNSLVEMNRTV